MRTSPRSLIATAGIGVALLAFAAGCSSDGVTAPVAPVAPAAPALVFTSLELTPSSFTLFTFEPLKTRHLLGVAKDQWERNIAGGARSFSSSDLNVATVDASGLVTAVAPGDAEISVSVTIEGVTKTAAAVVTVAADQIASAGRIAFIRRGGIFTVNPDGSDLVQLTTADDEGHDAMPVWSPDGSRLAFVHYQGPSIQWYLCVTGSGTQDPSCISVAGISGRPAWSPDGNELAFLGRPSATDQLGLYLTDLHSTRAITTLNEASGCWGFRDVSWSSANRIAIAYCNDISTINPDGSGVQILTRPVPSNFEPMGVAWSPDGQSLAVAFLQTDCWDSCGTVLGRLDANGTEFHILVPDPGWGGFPAWSRDGTKIVYTVHYGSPSDVWLVTADGSARGIIVKDGHSPSWGP